MQTSLADLEHVTSFLNASDPHELCLEGSESRLRDCDVVFLVWDLLVSVLTIKHIGGIVFVAEAIAQIVRRLTRWWPSMASCRRFRGLSWTFFWTRRTSTTATSSCVAPLATRRPSAA